MAIFNNMAITSKGQVLYAKAQAGKELKFTKMMVGSGKITTQDPALLTALLEPKYDVGIQSITPNTAQKNAAIAGFVNNSNMTEAVYICEIGLFAHDPDDGEILYAYGTAGQNGEFGDYMAPASSGPYSWNYVINAAVGNAANVTVVLSNLSYDYSMMNSNTTFIYLSGANQKEINTSIDAELKKLHDSIDNIGLASATENGFMSKEDFTKLKNIDKNIFGTLTTNEKDNLVIAINEVLKIANSAFQSASNGKSSVANAITGKGGSATNDMTFDQLASSISNIQTKAKTVNGISNTASSGGSSISINIGYKPTIVYYTYNAYSPTNGYVGTFTGRCVDGGFTNVVGFDLTETSSFSTVTISDSGFTFSYNNTANGGSCIFKNWNVVHIEY